jgi:hypothetical protein
MRAIISASKLLLPAKVARAKQDALVHAGRGKFCSSGFGCARATLQRLEFCRNRTEKNQHIFYLFFLLVFIRTQNRNKTANIQNKNLPKLVEK